MTKDIIIKKKEVWLSESYLVEALKGLSDEYLRKRGRSLKDAWQNQKINGQFYYLFDSIPNKKPTCYQSQLPSVETLRGLAKVKKRTVLGEAVIVEIVERALASDYAGYMPLYRETPAQQRGLAEAAAILAGLADYIVESGMEKRAQYGFLQGCATVLGGMKRQRFYLPTNVRRLQDKVNQMLAPLPPKGGFCEMGGAKTDVTDLVVSEGRRGDITDVIFAPRMGNSNSLKYTDEEVKAWCMILRGSGLNVKTIMIIRKVRLLCEVYGKLIPSEGWFNVFFANWGVKHLTAGGRWADNSHIQRFKSYVPHARPIHAGDAWEMDGTRFNIIAWKEKDAVTGKWHEKYV